MNEALPRHPDDLVARVRDYLRQADLSEITKDTLANHLGAPFETIRCRLRKAGTNWQREKTLERQRRLRLFMAREGKPRVAAASAECGFASREGFLLFFKAAVGQTFTQWRISRQQNYLADLDIRGCI